MLPSTRHTQCQVTFRKALSNSKNGNIRCIHESTKTTNVQYDRFLSTKDAITQIRNLDETRIRTELTTQSLVIKSIWELADANFTKQWSNVLQILPPNIFSFATRYLSNTLANGSNAIKWGITNSASCLFCDKIQTLGHVIGGCLTALEEKRYNWRHDSVLQNIVKSLNVHGFELFCDTEGYANPSIVTGESERPDLVVRMGSKLLILELTVGFEPNMLKNFQRKKERYERLISNLSSSYTIKYVNLSMGAIGIISNGSEFKSGFEFLGLSNELINFMIKRIINVCIRTSYFIFCSRNKAWDNPALMFW